MEYIAVPKGGQLSTGVKLGHGPKQTTRKTVQYDADPAADNNPTAVVEPVAAAATAAPAAAGIDQTDHGSRTDALTKKPLDLEAEEETRKLETSRWLESHFGSESSGSTTTDGPSRPSKSKGAAHPKGEADSNMPSQLFSGGINVTMTSDPSGSDRYGPTSGINGPSAVQEPLSTSRIYATTGRLNQQKYSSASERIQQQQQVLADKSYGFGSPPQSPTYKSSTSGYQSAPFNHVSKPEVYRQSSPAVADNPIKRAASFNQSAASAGRQQHNYSWTSKEESTRDHQQARQSFLTSMNSSSHMADKYGDDQQPTYAAPIQKRWPPPAKPIDDDEDDIRTSTPVYQKPVHQSNGRNQGGTIIRLGPNVPEFTSHSLRKPSGSGLARTQSLFQPSGSKPEPDRSYYNNSNNISDSYNKSVNNSISHSTSRMNLLNSSLQSVPEREQRSRFSPPRYYVDTERSFQSLNPSNNSNPKVIQSYSIKTPPPRPAPPSSSHYGSGLGLSHSGNKLRGSESFRIARSPPMFADDFSSPPVRPVRRKSKRAPKTDSGTQCNPQTIRNDTIQQQQQQQHYHSQTLDRPNKPIQKYYLGEDPFENRKKMTNGQSVLDIHRIQPAASTPRAEIVRSQTLPRRPSKPLATDSANVTTANLSSSRFFSDHDRSLNETAGGTPNVRQPSRIIPVTPLKSQTTATTSSSNSTVNRSQSFHVENQSSLTGQRRSSLLHSTPLRSVSIRAGNSPLYKSTSFLNRSSENRPFASLKSPGIVTSISKSQLDLNKSSTELNMIQPSSLATDSSPLYTLPRRKPSTKTTPLAPIEIRQDVNPTVSKVQSGIGERLAQLSPDPISPTTGMPRGETFSSLHRKRMQAGVSSTPAPPTPPPPPPPPSSDANGSMNFQTSTKATHRSYRTDTIKEENETKNTMEEQPEVEPEARSLKERIALLESAGIHYANPAQTLPRVVGGKTKAPPPPPPPRGSSALSKPEGASILGRQEKEESPEVESVEKRQKFLEGLLNTAPELFMHIHGDESLKDIRVGKEDVIDGKSGSRMPRTPSPPSAGTPVFNRIFTSTPAHPLRMSDSSAGPITPPPQLIRRSSGESPFGSGGDLALRRGSLNSTGSGSIMPAVKIPAPVNYSETVRIKSNQDPDSQSDSVQSYSKRVQPLVDGFSSETKQSSQQTTLTRSEYTDRRGSTDGSMSPIYHSIRPQQSGGVIIQVRGSGQ